MTNPMILELVPSLFNGHTSGNANPLKSGEGDGHFLTDMQKALCASKNNAFHKTDRISKLNTTADNKGSKYYLELLKKELLAQGKPLNKTFLNKDDLPLIQKFLLQCGFSHEKVEQLLKDLKANNPNGKIDLSQILLKMSELEGQKRKEDQDKILSSSAVPYIESILREFDLTPKELDSVFSKARIKGGGLDFHKFLEKLKEIRNQRPLADKSTVNQTSLEDFIASLERITANTGKEKGRAADINHTLDKILERVEFSERRQLYNSSVKMSSKYNFTDSSLEKVKIRMKSDADTLTHSEKADSMSKLNKQVELINSMKKEGYHVDKKAQQLSITKNTEVFNITNTFKTIESGEKSFRGYLPTSLVEQIGKQISRSLLRGSQVVTLQLKPPDLGTVRIRIDIKDHTLKLNMVAEHQSIKELLLNNVHELKESLVQHGVKLEKIDVQVNSNFGQSLNASKEGPDSGHEWKHDFNGKGFQPDNPSEGAHERPVNILSRNNLLDLVA